MEAQTIAHAPPTYRDLAIEILTDRLITAEDARETYRTLAQEAIHALAAETRRHDVTRESLARERDESRRLRASS